MASRYLLALALAVLTAGAPRLAHAQDGDVLVEEPDAALRLDAWFSLEAHRASQERVLIGAVAIGVGVLGGVTSGYLFTLDDPSETLLTLSKVALTLSVLDIGLGVVALLRSSDEQERLTRFRRAQARGLTPIDAALFEGELRAAALSAERVRYGIRWGGVALLAAGAVTLSLNAALTANDERGYWIGGVTAGTGLLAVLLSLITAEVEDDWHDYSRGLRPARTDEAHVHLTPSLGPSMFGIGLTGTF